MEEQNNSEPREQFVWKRKFTGVLVVNAIYVVLFYLLMKHFA
ncbi:MAG: hypothetical protein ACJAYD_000153 [Patiriisocius sp.]|jgi:hypothetical protein